jgi:phage-related protein
MSDAFYDRTTGNISGVNPLASLISEFPAYGSKVSMSSRNSSHETQNGFYNMMPMSVNNLNAKFELRYDLPENEAQQLVRFLELKSGQEFIEFNDSSNFYKTVSGVCDNYAINHMNKQHYEVAFSLEVFQASSIFNWSGMSYVNTSPKTWGVSQPYKKYDILYSGVNANKLNNFYYSTEDHMSVDSAIDGPTGSASKWSQSFFFEPDIGIQNDVKMRVDTLDFKNSFIQKINSSRNISLVNWQYKFENIDDQKAKAIFHFLENKFGYRRFFHTPSSVYNRLKVYHCPSWQHTWNYNNSHTLEVEIVEDPLGIVPIDQ